MTAQPSCPDPARLRELLDGTLREPQQAELTSHLDTCVSCQQTLEMLAAGGKSWPGPAREPTPPESALRRAMADLKGYAGEAPTQSGPGGGRDAELDFLDPAEHPGHLGRLGRYP